MVGPADGSAVLLGLACGDALGRPVEFQSADEIAATHGRVTELLADGTHGQPAGTVTDDTELALCLARSLLDRGGFDGRDVADRFLAWYEDDPFDVGLLTADALRAYRRGAGWRDAGREVWRDRPEGQNAGTGRVMRCAPHAIAFADDPEALVRISRRSSAITHADPRCTWGCAVLNCTIAGLARGDPSPLEAALAFVERAGTAAAARDDLPVELLEALRPVPDRIDPEQLRPTGYVVDTLQIALQTALTADSAEEAIVTAVSRGGDTDTIGAVTGALAGARFGSDGLPDRWLSELQYREDLDLLGRALATMSFDAPS